MMNRRSFLAALAAGSTTRLWPAPAAPGPGLIYAGTLNHKVIVIDEAQEKVVDQIALETGVPRGLRLSSDKKRIYVQTPLHSGVEVIDLASHKLVNHFTLDEGNRRWWFRGFAPDPEDKFIYTVGHARVKLVDRFDIEKPKFLVIDIAQRKLAKTVDYPKDEANAFLGGNIRFSPDGKYLYHFRDNILIFNTADFKLEEKIELSKPQYPGMESINLGPGDDPHDEPGVVTALFNSTDPIVHRRVFGIAKVDLAKRTFDFTPVGPSTTGMHILRLTPDRKTGYTFAFYDNLGNRRAEFWVFDMTTNQIVKRVEYPGYPGFGFTLSSTGQDIYINGSYPFIDVYEAATLKQKKQLDVNTDLTTNLVVVPPRAA